VVGTTTTAADGTYYFNDTNATLNGGLVPGAAYRVRLQRATDFASGGALFNFVPTATNAGGKDKIDSDASIVSGSPQISLTAPRFGADHSFDLGFVRTSVTVGDVVFIDTDKDGIQEAGDPGIPNVVVTITGPGGVAVTDVFGNAVTSTTTDAAGTYTFANLPSLPAGQGYTVRIDNAQAALAAFAPTLTGQGTPATDSSNGSAVSGDLVNDKDADPQLDFGFVRKSVSVGDLVFVDADRDGVQDATEIGLAGVTATLVGPTGAAVTNVNGVVVGPVVTGANGSYTFADLPVLAAGQGYTVKVDNTQAALADYVPTTTGQGTTLTDSSNGSAASGPLTANGARDASLDFGFVKKAVSVGDLVFVDTDRDGVQHAGDAGISGVTVTITRTDGAVVRTTTGSAVTSTTTNTTGGYLFGNLEALPTGVFYKVSVDNAQAALAAYVPTVTGAGTPATDSSTGSATSVALVTNGASDLTLDFGFVRPAVTVGDLVFVDTDKDGIQDAGEPGLSGVTVTIVGPNGLAVTNANGAVVGPVTTGANGQYSFTLLPALPAGQSYTIKIDNNQAALADYVPSPAGAGTPATDSSNGSAASGALTTNGSSDTTLDFGFFRKSVSVGDLVFVDTDRDGVQEAGEPGISGVTVTITRTDGGTVRTIGGTTVTSTTTGAAGGYLFGNLEALPAGVFYKVSVDNAQAALAAYVPTVTGAGTPANDSSTGSATSGALVQNGASDLTLDFGFVKPAVSVGDFVFVDADRDGVQDAGEPGLAGVVVTIVGPNGAAVTNVNGNVVGPVTTGANGQYTFGLLPVLPLGQTYTVKVDNSQAALADYAPAPTGAGTPTTDSSNASAASGPLTTDGASDTSLDFGFVKKVVSVGDFVFLDNDRDGVQDAGDTGIQGVTVTITRTDGAVVRTATGSTVTSTTTNASGGYLFGNLEALPAGTHYVTRVDNAQAALNGFVPTLTGQGTTPNDSSNGSAESVNLIANGASDLTLDFGFVRPAVSVGDLVFADTNGNGIQNAGEPGIAGVTVTIVGPNGLAVTNVNGAVVGPVATGTDGQYAFQLLPVLPVGQGYTVRVDNAQAALDGYVPTLTGQGAVATDSSNGSATSGNVATNGATDTTLDFGFVRESVSVGDFVWLDTNRNGIQNAGEPGIQGVTVTITRTDGVPVRTVAGATVTSTTTSAAGAYLFPDLETLPAGTHYVARVDNGQAALAAYVSTTTGQGTPATDSSNGSAESVNLTVDGASDLTLDFGFVRPAVSVGDHVFVDANGNGIQDAGDTGLQGVRLTVVGPGGNPVTDVNGTLVGAATSGANGQYTFDLLPALAAGQSYTVRVDNGQTALLAHVPTLTGQGTAATDSSNGSAASAAALTANGASDRTLDFGFRAAGPALSLDKTASAIDDVDGNGPDAGDRITYGFRVTNTGNVPLNPVTVADPKVGPVTCPTGSLAVGATVTCTPVVYTLTQADVTAGAVDNTATATGTAPNAAKVTDDDSTATPVAVQKVRVGDFVWVDTDRDGIQDAGENGIANVRLTLVGPGGAAVTDVFGNVVGAATTDAAGRYAFADLPALATGQSYTVRIDNTQAALAAYVPTATGQGTPATDSSTGSATSGNLTTDGASDLTLDFGFKKSSVSVGDLVFVDTNGNGTQDAGEPGLPGIRLTIVGPGGQPVTNVDGTTVGAATTDGLGRYSFDGLPTLPAGQGYTVKLDGTQVALNGYTPAPTGQGTPATDSSNGSATSGDLSTSGASDKTLDFGFVRDDQDGLANLKVTKSVDRATPAVGEVVTYTLTVTNDGDAAATNVVLKDVLPSQVTFVSADAPCTQASGTVSCELGTLAAGQTRTVTVKARVDNVPAGTTEERHNLDVQKAEVVLDVEAGQTGTASVTCPSGSTVLDGSARVVSSGADVAITESRATSLTTWTATLVNQGTQRAQNKVFALCVVNQTETVNGHSHQLQVSPAAVTQTAAVPAGSSDLTLSCAAGQTPVQPGWKLDGAADVQTSYPSGSSSWTFGVVNEGAATSGLFSIRCLKNQVSTVNGHSHDLALAELFRTVTVPAGQSVDVVLDCADSALGNQGAKGVVAGFDLPAGLLNLGHEPQPIRRVYTLSNTTSGPLDADLWLLCLGTRTAGHDGSGDVVNAASVTTTSPERTVSDNVASARFRVTATAPAPVDKANLSVTKTVGDTTPRVGDTVSYTLRVTNNGDVAAAGVVLTDALPSGVTFGSATAPCTLNGSTVRCELGSVAPGATKTVTITATVDAAPSASSSHDHYLDVQKVEQHVALTAGETRTATVDCAPGYLATDGSGRVDQIDQGTGTADAVRIIRSAAADEDSWSVTMVNTATGSAQGKAFVVCTKKTTDVADGHTHDLAHGAPVTATRALTVGATSVTLTCATGRPIAPSYSVPADASVRQTYPVGTDGWAFTVDSASAGSADFSIRCLETRVSTADGHQHDLVLTPLTQTTTVAPGQTVEITSTCAGDAKGVVAGFQMDLGLVQLGNDPRPIIRVFRFHNPTSSPLDVDVSLLCLMSRTSANSGSGTVVNTAYATTSTPETTTGDNTASASFKVDTSAPAPVASPASTVVTVAPRQAFVSTAVKCSGTVACTGTAVLVAARTQRVAGTLVRKGAVLARATYKVTSGRTATVKMRPSAFGKKVLASRTVKTAQVKVGGKTRTVTIRR
ncbi:MAG: Cna domain protein, partial [Nocardioides sp.]|nr:Cna domain protein [Nocardioides sp.]